MFVAYVTADDDVQGTAYRLGHSTWHVVMTSEIKGAPIVYDTGMQGAVRALEHASASAADERGGERSSIIDVGIVDNPKADAVPPLAIPAGNGYEIDPRASQALMALRTQLDLAVSDVLDEHRFAWTYTVARNDTGTRRPVQYRLTFNGAPCYTDDDRVMAGILASMPRTGPAICSSETLAGRGPSWYVAGVFRDMLELEEISLAQRVVHDRSGVITLAFAPGVYVMQQDIHAAIDAIDKVFDGYLETGTYPRSTPDKVVANHHLTPLPNGQWRSSLDLAVQDVYQDAFTLDTPIQLYRFLQWAESMPGATQSLEFHVSEDNESTRVVVRTEDALEYSRLRVVKHVDDPDHRATISFGGTGLPFFDMTAYRDAVVRITGTGK